MTLGCQECAEGATGAKDGKGAKGANGDKGAGMLRVLSQQWHVTCRNTMSNIN